METSLSQLEPVKNTPKATSELLDKTHLSLFALGNMESSTWVLNKSSQLKLILF